MQIQTNDQVRKSLSIQPPTPVKKYNSIHRTNQLTLTYTTLTNRTYTSKTRQIPTLTPRNNSLMVALPLEYLHPLEISSTSSTTKSPCTLMKHQSTRNTTTS